MFLFVVVVVAVDGVIAGGVVGKVRVCVRVSLRAPRRLLPPLLDQSLLGAPTVLAKLLLLISRVLYLKSRVFSTSSRQTRIQQCQSASCATIFIINHFALYA